ncbi:replication protein [Staphylococcus casei]|uniref:replication protein n=1 Tax=Staphylococcus casei TaxID=201828 RepID=UPI000CD0A0FE|nr:replication protein [Staphylococcus casei]PNZ62705.1 replication protein [Staphylococcus casei]WJE87815.1 replication protein [Staphylococcus casei]
MANKDSQAKARTRNWTFVIYPESVLPNWRDILDDEHIQWVESPLHDKDTNADGEIKKAHIHVLVMYDGVKSYNQILEITEKINATIPQKCGSAKGLVRYMVHMDNPEKYQYLKTDIIGHGGVDIMDMLKPTSGSRYEMFKEMTEFILENDIREYETLWIYAMQNRFDDWFPLLSDNGTFAINNFIKSRRHRIDKEK